MIQKHLKRIKIANILSYDVWVDADYSGWDSVSGAICIGTYSEEIHTGHTKDRYRIEKPIADFGYDHLELLEQYRNDKLTQAGLKKISDKIERKMLNHLISTTNSVNIENVKKPCIKG